MQRCIRRLPAVVGRLSGEPDAGTGPRIVTRVTAAPDGPGSGALIADRCLELAWRGRGRRIHMAHTTRIALSLSFVISTLLAGCATDPPVSSPQTEDVTEQVTDAVIFCEVEERCSTTGELFDGVGSPGQSLATARNACLAVCSGTCTLFSRDCCNTGSPNCT
jgi:hypothetical protein